MSTLKDGSTITDVTDSTSTTGALVINGNGGVGVQGALTCNSNIIINGVDSKLIHKPVGFIYLSLSGTNPAAYFLGTWEAYGVGKLLVSYKNAQSPDYNTVGAKTVAIGTTDSLDYHSHTGTTGQDNGSGGLRLFYVNGKELDVANTPIYSAGWVYYGWYWYDSFHQHIRDLGYSGASAAHNNIQPSMTVYMWRRSV